jgi:hypothetical protein
MAARVPEIMDSNCMNCTATNANGTTEAISPAIIYIYEMIIPKE